MKRVCLLLPLLLFVLTTLSLAQVGNVRSSSTRLREGTMLHDHPGRFQTSGERILFFPENKTPESFRVLENLAVERVANDLIENQDSNRWLVTGMVTEYRGVNYLLISKAVMQGDR